MAILINSESPMRGSVGNFTYVNCKGKIIVRQKVTPKSTPSRSAAQMRQRMRWGNMVTLYRLFDQEFKPYFEDKKEGSNDYNTFLSANMSAQPIFINKEAQQMHGCVVSNYQVSRGSLPAIATEVKEGKCVSNILLGELVIDDLTTVGEFSEAVISNNKDFEEYDLLFHVFAMQTVDSMDVPRVKVLSSRVVLDVSDDTPLSFVVRGAGFSNEGGYLGMCQTVSGAVAYVHGRRTRSKALVSTQQLVVTCEQSATYGNEEAFQTAATSYGGINKRGSLLTPEVDREPSWTEVGEGMFSLKNKVLPVALRGNPPPSKR